MDSTLRKLTLTCPQVLESAFLDMLDSLENLPGYTILNALGRGSTIDQLNQQEKVIGAMNTLMIIFILPESQIDQILSAVATNFSHTQITYWVEPVLDFARLQ
jgi:nitrogen regulatory protein PII